MLTIVYQFRDLVLGISPSEIASGLPPLAMTREEGSSQ
jgi:hypothetical protein